MLLKVFTLRGSRDVEGLQMYVAAYWEDFARAGKAFAVQILPAKALRTYEQNKRYWKMLVMPTAAQAWERGRQKTGGEWHDLFKRKFIGEIDLPDGTTAAMSSALLTVEEFSLFMTEVEAYVVSELGVEITELE